MPASERPSNSEVNSSIVQIRPYHSKSLWVGQQLRDANNIERAAAMGAVQPSGLRPAWNFGNVFSRLGDWYIEACSQFFRF